MRRHFALVLCVIVLLCRAASAADQWIEVKSSRVTLLTNGGEKNGRKSLDQIERMRWVFQKLFPEANVDPAAPIQVVAAKDEETFTRFEPAEYLAKGSMKVGGYFLRAPDKNYILLRLDGNQENPYTTVYHEYTHLQFSSTGEWMPIWLNEGIAQFFQNTKIDGKEVRLGQASVDEIFYLRDRALIPLNVLLAVDKDSPYYHEEGKGSTFYAESWALTHYLMITDRQMNLHRVNDYIDLLRNHEDPVQAGQKAFGDLKRLEKELGRYIQQAMYMEFAMNSGLTAVDQSTYQVRPVSQAEADARRADVLAYVRRTDEAHTLAEGVLKADPTNAQAKETLGFLAYRAGKTDEAKKLYEEAAKLGSQDFLTYFYLAQFSMRERTGDGDEIVPASLRKAIELNPRFAASYDRLASYLAIKHESLDDAHLLSVKAVELDPGNINYRMNAANVLMEMERYGDALNVLRAAAKMAQNQGDAALVQTRIDQLEQFQSSKDSIEMAEKQEARGGTADVAKATGPAHPTVTAAAKAHGFDGVIRGVKCSPPYAIEFRVENGAGKGVLVYNNNFTSIELSASGFDPPDSMDPCHAFEGMKANVQYLESSDKTVDGQVTAVELKR
jgi:tetratricopeptide (TPR) repeat protein